MLTSGNRAEDQRAYARSNDDSNTSDQTMPLSNSHLQMLSKESAIDESVILARGYKTVIDKKDLAMLGFAKSQQLTPGLLLPVYAPDGSNGLFQFRPNAPRVSKQGKLIKYETPMGAAMRLDCSPICRPQLADPSIPLWMTEGIKKGDALVSHGFCAVALLGVWNFKGTNDLGGVAVLADFDFIAWNGREVRICFDSDIMQKSGVRKAMERLTEILERKGANVSAVYLPDIGQGKTGVDDFLRLKGKDELEKLITQPKPTAQFKLPTFEILDALPDALRRPLQIIDGRTYAATWLYVKKTIRESLDENGNIIQHNPPKEETTRSLFVMRDDGKFYGYGQKDSLDALGFDVVLPEAVPEKLLLQKRAVEFYQAGNRKDAVDVFFSLQNAFDRFLDFDRSLAEQQTMSELTACYTLSTWFTEAFNVTGYVWATGERGSGKTQLLLLICELGFLGQFVQASGTLASLRDLADYGAFLGFDDAEQVSNKNFDPDKRNLLLAGNRRGSQIPLKEPVPNSREWRIRYINTFCPRGFTATRSPDTVLGSRAITIPLVRTADKRKGDADPLDETCWTRKPDEIRQNLWLVALAHLSEMQQFDREAASRASLTGRNLEAWRGVLAVAALIDAKDKEGILQREIDGKQTKLFERMNQLSITYQSERAELESADITRLALRAVIALITGVTDDVIELDVLRSSGKCLWKLQSEKIAERAQRFVRDEELDFDIDSINARRIGRCLGKLRLKKDRKGGKGTHGWQFHISELEKLLSSFGLLKCDFSPLDSNTQKINATDVTNVTNVTRQTGTGDISDLSDGSDVLSLQVKKVAGNLTPTDGKLFPALSTEINDASQSADHIPTNYNYECWVCKSTVSSEDSCCPNCNQDLNDFPF